MEGTLKAECTDALETFKVHTDLAHRRESMYGYNASAVRTAKEAVSRAMEITLVEGILHERHVFQAAFATDGQKEGMQVFLARRADLQEPLRTPPQSTFTPFHA